MTCDEAFVWYGHLALPDYTSPSGDARQFLPRRPGERVPAGSPPGATQMAVLKPSPSPSPSPGAS